MNPMGWTRLRDPSRCLSDLAFDQLAAGDDQGTLVTEARRAHLRQCAACEARRETLDADRSAVLRRWPTLDRPDAGGRIFPPARLRWFAGALVAGAAALGAAVLVTRAPGVPALRVKGGFALEVVVRRADGQIETLLPGATVSGGDALRFRVTADGAGGLVTLVAVDEAGAVSGYDPTPEALPVLAAGERRLLEGSVELDGSIGRERLLGLLCPDRAHATAAVQELKRKGLRAGDAHPTTHAGCRVADFPFQKVAPL